MLELTKPIIFFDIEATGLSTINDRIVQIALLKIYPGGRKESANYLFNPGIKMSAEVIAIHGITDEKVKDCPDFKVKAKEIADFIGACDLGGYNLLKFDVPMLLEEFIRAEVEFEIENRQIVDVQGIFHKMEQRTLAAAYKFYCNRELTNAHDAEADNTATYEVLLAQLVKYPDIKKNPAGIVNFIGTNNRVDLEGRIVKNEKGEMVFNFGKHKGKKVTHVFETEPSYYNWILDGEFSGYTKKIVQKIKLNMLKDKFNNG